MQISANYKLDGRTVFQGLPISIENKKGSVRQGVDKVTGKPWRTLMKFDYGYIRKSDGVDGDAVDCYIGPNENAKYAFVINQNDPNSGKFDEQKVMLGWDNSEDAKKAYFQHYDNPERFFGSIEAIPMEKFKQKVLATFNNPKKIAAQFKLEAAMMLYLKK